MISLLSPLSHPIFIITKNWEKSDNSSERDGRMKFTCKSCMLRSQDGTWDSAVFLGFFRAIMFHW
jgi:hypothetical protein